MLSHNNNQNQVVSFKRGLSIDKKLMLVEILSFLLAVGMGMGVGTGLSYLDQATDDQSTASCKKSNNLWYSTFNSLIVILTYIFVSYAFENHVCNKTWIRALSLARREGLPLINPDLNLKDDNSESFKRFDENSSENSVVKKQKMLAEIVGFLLGCGLGTAVGAGLSCLDKRTDDLSSKNWQYSDNLWHSTLISFLAILPYLFVTKITKCFFEEKMRPFIVIEHEGNPLLSINNISKNLANYS